MYLATDARQQDACSERSSEHILWADPEFQHGWPNGNRGTPAYIAGSEVEYQKQNPAKPTFYNISKFGFL